MSPAARWPEVSEVVEAVHNGRAAVQEVVGASLRRISELDGQLGAFLATGPTSREHAGRETQPAGTSGGALAGVPVAVKDNIATVGLPLSCGSRVLEGYAPSYDASAVRRLRDAGAVVVGKTNMDEFAMGSSTETSAFAACKNPWDPERVPGGSSGGSAAAVAAALTPVALGSDTGGSVRQPAAFCGVVGFKPSYGAVSRFGLVSYASSLDSIGMLATRVADVSEIFAAVRGPDGLDETVEAFDWARPRGGDSRPIRVGVVSECLEQGGVEPAVRQAVSKAAECCSEAGMVVEEISISALDETVIPAYYLTATAEASSNLSRYDGVRYGRRSDAAADGAHQMVQATRTLFGWEVQLRILLGTFVLRAGHYDRFYGRAQAARRRIAQGLNQALSAADVLLTPTAPTRAFERGEMIDDPVRMKLADLFTVTANLAGLPAISLPVELVDGLPTAVQLMAARFDDDALLRTAALLEQQLGFDPRACPMAQRGPAVWTPKGGDR